MWLIDKFTKWNEEKWHTGFSGLQEWNALFTHGVLKAALDSSKLSAPKQLLISQKLTYQRQIKNQQWKTPTADTEFDQMCYFVPHEKNSYDTTNIFKN